MRTIERNGRKYAVTIETDDSQEGPWEREDGHGPVSDWTTRSKRPGERILNSDRGSHRYYDFQAAVETAKRDRWDAPPYGGTAGQRAARAAEDDFQRLRAWCNDEWQYVGVIVTPLCPCCGEPQKDKSESLWGIESDARDYLETVALELLDECEPEACCAEGEA